MTVNTTSILSSDILFQQQETENNSNDNRQGSVAYSRSLSAGTGSLQIDAVYNIQTVQIDSASSYYIDFNNLSQPVVGGFMNLSFNNIKSICISNLSVIIGEDLSIRATGSDGLTEPFNGASGSFTVKPSASYMYSDPYTGAVVDGSNKNFYIHNAGTGTGEFTLVAVGVTG